jgi:hypothetical protein
MSAQEISLENSSHGRSAWYAQHTEDKYYYSLQITLFQSCSLVVNHSKSITPAVGLLKSTTLKPFITFKKLTLK